MQSGRGNLIVGGGIASVEWGPCSGKVVLEIAEPVPKRKRGISLLAKTVEEYVSQASGLSSSDGFSSLTSSSIFGSSSLTSKTLIP